jgi:hypothetical protein
MLRRVCAFGVVILFFSTSGTGVKGSTPMVTMPATQ